ncbi:hypothetical protein RI367_002646 [Sorochytrium milnesiophthora]
MLPPEIVSIILAHAHLETLASMRDARSLRWRLRSYYNGLIRSKEVEQRATDVCLRADWSEGVELLVEYDIFAVLWSECVLQSVVALKPATIQKLWLRQCDAQYHQNLAVLVHNIGNTNAADDIAKWCCDRSRQFANALAVELMRKDGTLDDLRVLWRRLELYIDDNDLSERYQDATVPTGSRSLHPVLHQHLGGIQGAPARAIELSPEAPQLDELHEAESRYTRAQAAFDTAPLMHMSDFRAKLYAAVAEYLPIAIGSGRLDIVEQVYGEHPRACSPALLSHAIAAGKPDIVLWLLERFTRDGVDFALDARNYWMCGDLAVAQRLLSLLRTRPTMGDLGHAIASGNGALVELCLTANPALVCKYEMLVPPVQAGNLALVKLLATRIDMTRPTLALLDIAATAGHLRVLQWLQTDADAYGTALAMDTAAKFGRLDILQSLWGHRPVQCSWQGTQGAIDGGHVDVLDWLLQTEMISRTPGSGDRAAGRGLLAVVKWFAANMPDCFTAGAPFMAAAGGYMDVVRWLRHNGPPNCIALLTGGAEQRDHLSTLHEQFHHIVPPNLMTVAAIRGDLLRVRMLHSYGDPGCTLADIPTAPEHVKEWFRQHRP